MWCWHSTYQVENVRNFSWKRLSKMFRFFRDSEGTKEAKGWKARMELLWVDNRRLTLACQTYVACVYCVPSGRGADFCCFFFSLLVGWKGRERKQGRYWIYWSSGEQQNTTWDLLTISSESSVNFKLVRISYPSQQDTFNFHFLCAFLFTAQGAKGERGKIGVPGLKGAKGILGDTGKPGEQGERGTDVSVLIMTSGGIFTCRLNRGRVVCAEW